MDRALELENIRRSIAMLRPGTCALDREDAMGLIGELQDVQRRLEHLRNALALLLEEA